MTLIERGATLTDVFGEPLPQDLVVASIKKLAEIFPNPKNRLSAMEAVENMFLNSPCRHISELGPEIEPLLKEGRKERLDEAIVVLAIGYTADRNRKEPSQWDLEINRLQSLMEAAQTALRKLPRFF